MSKVGKKILVLICVACIAVCAVSFGYLLIKRPKLNSGDMLNISIEDDKDRTTKDENLSDFSSIKGSLKYTDVYVLKGDKFKIHVDYNTKVSDISYKVNNGVLELNETGKGNKNTFNFKGNTIKIYVPENTAFTLLDMTISSGDFSSDKFNYKDLKITDSYGDVSINNGEFETINIQCKSGDIEFNNIKFTSCTINNSYGDIKLDKAQGNTLSMDDKSGDVELKNTNVKDAVKVQSSYGNFDGNTIECKELSVDMKSGNVNIEDGKILNSNITSSYGNVEFENKMDENQFNYNIKCNYGDINVNGNDIEKEYVKNNGMQNSVNIDCSSGDVELQFKK